MVIDSFLSLTLLVAAASTSAATQTIVRQVEVPGATLHIEVRQPVSNAKADELIDWVESAARNVNLTYGRFPNPAPRIIITPSKRASWGKTSAVIFGQVTRNRGETVELFVNPDRPIAEFYEDWTATHEFSHLMLPLLSQRYRWISEGFATYYQNVLMMRAERYTPEFGWQRLTAGFARGHDSRPELSPNEAAAGGIAQARMKVYWSGAAIALLADTELRQRSDGKESLDTVLSELQHCCLPSRRRWSGRELFERLDSFLETPVFMPLYREHANEAGFPPVDAVVAELGIETASDEVSLRDNAPLADIRDAISTRQ